MLPPASAQARSAIPGGGSVALPSPYNRKPSYPAYSERIADRALIGYRNWRSTMSGHPECDGMLGVARSAGFRDLTEFVETCRAALSIQWSVADRILGQAWTDDEKRYRMESHDSADGPELIQQLAVHRVGFFRVYDEPALMYAVQHKVGVSMAIWLYDTHGGVSHAHKLAHRIAASFET